MNASARLTQDLGLRLVVADAQTLPVEAALTYDPADPYAVTAVFHADDSDSVTWTFGRDLLHAGLSAMSGYGDVGVWPSTSDGQPVVCITLCSPSGQALLEASRSEVEAFIAATHERVPFGAESQHLDIEGALEHLLAG